MTDHLLLRLYEPSDADGVAHVFHDAVMIGTRGHYDEAQRRAWAGGRPDPERWRRRLDPLRTLVAEEWGRVVGFMALAGDGLLDLAFVAPSHHGRGVGRRLHDRIEGEARRMGLSRLRTEASHAARPFFLRRGWRHVASQSVEINGVSLENHRMKKDLTDDAGAA